MLDAVDPKVLQKWLDVEFETKLMEDMRGTEISTICPDNAEDWTTLYLIECAESGWIKVGISSDPVARRGQLQCANPHPLHIRSIVWFRSPRHAYAVEQNIHKQLRTWRVLQGASKEWFKFDWNWLAARIVMAAFTLDMDKRLANLRAQRLLDQPELADRQE